jgi:hypothetical protein
MWKRFRQWRSEKVDVKITGYICVGIFCLTVLGLLVMIGFSAGMEGALPEWSAAAGIIIMLVNAWNIFLARWGQEQTGRKLIWNRVAVILSGCMIGVMALIYIMGIG